MPRVRVGVKLRDGPSLIPQIPIRNPFVLGRLFGGGRERRYAEPIPYEPTSSFAEGEDIGIRQHGANVPLGARNDPSGATGGLETVLARAAVSSVARGQAAGGSRPEDFEEGGVFAGPQPEYEYEGQPWDPYDTPGLSDPEEEQPPVVIPIDAAEELLSDQQTNEEDESMPSFTDILSGAIDIAQGQRPGGQIVQDPYGFAGPYVGQPIPPLIRRPGVDAYGRPCKRRRRRRLLTESDFNDLMRIATLPNKQNVTVALAKAVGRR